MPGCCQIGFRSQEPAFPAEICNYLGLPPGESSKSLAVLSACQAAKKTLLAFPPATFFRADSLRAWSKFS